MAVFDRVVVGVDGTEWGFEALRQALALAPAGAAVEAVTALHTGPAVWTGFDAPHWAELLTSEAQAARDASATLLAGRPCASARVVPGDPVDVLRRARDDGDATLLAIGGRHSSRLLGIVMGDTATELLHDAACSVLVARPGAPGTWEPRRVVVGVDASEPSRLAQATADELAARLGATVQVVSDAQQPVAALVERSRDSDLVVVGSRGLHGLHALGSVSERVAHRAACSVLVVHN